MATLQNLATGLLVVLRARTLIGRYERADIRLTARGASSEHAAIHWDGAGWTLRDLTSRNGTKINETLLCGREWRLRDGDLIIFGDPQERWRLLDGSPPKMLAIRDDGLAFEPHGGVLLLPHDEAPEASIYLQEETWEIDTGGCTRALSDGEEIALREHTYRLQLPCPDPVSMRTRTLRQTRSIALAHARFQVSQDEEHVALTLSLDDETFELPPRAFHYMLLVLARTLGSDQKAGCAPTEAGWIYTEELASKLRTSVEKLNVDVHRARRLVARMGVFGDPESIVQRRRTTGQLRFGISKLVFEVRGAARA